MPPDEANRDDDASISPPHSQEWWAAVRRVVARVLDAAEAAARSDARFRNDLARVFDAWPGGAHAAEVLDDARREASSPPAPDIGTDDQEAEVRASAPSAVVPALYPAPTPPADPGPAPAPPSAAPAPTPEPLPPLVGPREVSVSAGMTRTDFGHDWDGAIPLDGAAVASRCRLKADACRWQAERRRRLDAGADVSDEDRALASRGHQLGVRLWMTSPVKWRDTSHEAFITVGDCYDALADAAEAMASADQARHEQAAALRLLAESQSAVRAAVEGYASTRRDEDQEKVFAWLRHETDTRRVFVQFLQLEHPASPDDSADLRRRIAELGRRLRDRGDRARQVDQRVRKLQYQAGKLKDAGTSGEQVTAEHGAVLAIAATVEDLLAAGIPASDPRLRDALLGVASLVPPDVPPSLSRVMEAVDEYLDRLGEDDDLAVAEDRQGERQANDPLLGEARRRVAGRRAVLLGGRPNEPARQKLEQGLGLEELEWLRVEHHESFEPAARAIGRPGVGLVIILTRWRSHRDGPAARNACRERGIPLVEQPAGYSLRQVAHQICKQVPAPDGFSS